MLPSRESSSSIDSHGSKNDEKVDLNRPTTTGKDDQSAKRKHDEGTLPTNIVVKLYVTGVDPSYLVPWTVKGQSKWTGTGFVLPERRIMTNAHVAANATVIQVQKQENPKKYRGILKCLAHDLDLAIVTVEDDEFWENITTYGAFRENDHPELNSEVKACGFPTGGATVCVTKGVLSRIDAHLYIHPRALYVMDKSRNCPGNLLIYQIDAAINPGNSGGPTFDSDGFILGVVSSQDSRAQNIGYIIPAMITKLFLNEYVNTGSWSGQSEIGLHYSYLENDTMRDYLKMDDAATGVLVLSSAPMGALHGKVTCGDVITAVDDNQVSNEGKVPLLVSGQKVYISADALITQKPKGESTKISFLRNGQSQEVDVVFSPIPPLSPRYHDVDVTPEYILFGGFVFTRSSIPLRHEYYKKDKTWDGHLGNCIHWNPCMKWKQHENQQVVVMLRILEHDANVGYYDESGVVECVNDCTIDNIDRLAEILAKALQASSSEKGGEGGNAFVRIKISWDAPNEENNLSTYVLKTEKIQKANEDICRQYCIPAIASERLMKKYFSFLIKEK